MFNLETTQTLPVIKDLVIKYMPPNNPYRRISLISQPLVTNELGNEVCHLEGKVVHYGLLPRRDSLHDEQCDQ